MSHIPHNQRSWLKAAHGTLLVLAKNASKGGFLESDLLEIIGGELRIDPAIVADALDNLVRRGLIRREQQTGLLVSGDFYSLTPEGVGVLAGNPDNLLKFRVSHG